MTEHYGNYPRKRMAFLSHSDAIAKRAFAAMPNPYKVGMISEFIGCTEGDGARLHKEFAKQGLIRRLPGRNYWEKL